MKELVETVTKKPLAPHVKHLIVVVGVMDEESESDEDIDVSASVTMNPLVTNVGTGSLRARPYIT